MQQDDEFHQVRVGLLPERLLTATEQVIQQAGNSVCQRVSFEIVMKGIVPVSRFEAEFEVIVPRRPFYRSNLGTVAVLKPALALDFPR